MSDPYFSMIISNLSDKAKYTTIEMTAISSKISSQNVNPYTLLTNMFFSIRQRMKTDAEPSNMNTKPKLILPIN